MQTLGHFFEPLYPALFFFCSQNPPSCIQSLSIMPFGPYLSLLLLVIHIQPYLFTMHNFSPYCLPLSCYILVLCLRSHTTFHLTAHHSITHLVSPLPSLLYDFSPCILFPYHIHGLCPFKRFITQLSSDQLTHIKSCSHASMTCHLMYHLNIHLSRTPLSFIHDHASSLHILVTYMASTFLQEA